MSSKYRELKSLVIQDGWTSTCPHPINWWQELHRKKTGFGSDQEFFLEVLEHNKLNSIELATFQEVWRKNPK
jgi:hypothetical protein